MSLAGKFIYEQSFQWSKRFWNEQYLHFYRLWRFLGWRNRSNATQYVLKHASNRPMPLLPSHFLSVCAQVQIIFILQAWFFCYAAIQSAQLLFAKPVFCFRLMTGKKQREGTWTLFDPSDNNTEKNTNCTNIVYLPTHIHLSPTNSVLQLGMIWVKHHSIFHPGVVCNLFNRGFVFQLEIFCGSSPLKWKRQGGETSAWLLMGITNVSVIPLHLKLPSPSAPSQIIAKEWSWDSLPYRALVFSPAKRIGKIHPVALHHGG